MNYDNLTTEKTGALLDEKFHLEFVLYYAPSNLWKLKKNTSEHNIAITRLDKIKFELTKKYRR